ncbi:uncharacterized protein LOC131149174 isoform X1 [Malania oleifera]|uniref:uncharacterized protein LOC131149174 isoform X1 n=1 Tax=Malania oleifera TaxID=397392 RepID=UPI0025AE29D2|nr:uncharacterized protein LOC131149174 isoform X1 [Malania oleifera]
MACAVGGGGSMCRSSFHKHFSSQPQVLLPRTETGGIYVIVAMKVPGREGFSAFPNLSRRRISIKLQKANTADNYVKKASLFASKKERIKLQNYADVSGGKAHHISEFLTHQSGVETVLNKSALQNFQTLDSNIYRCTLPKIHFLNFEVAPILDLRVTPTSEDCTIEMLSCKFEGSDILERQNSHFSASMKNHITWDTNESEPFLDVDVKLNLTLELLSLKIWFPNYQLSQSYSNIILSAQIYTLPLALLPTSAVEGPGNLMMQALVDRLVPLLLQQLSQDYDKWVQQQLLMSSVHSSPLIF